jgi:hypothetical protein
MDAKVLSQHWVHSHEEDTKTEMVFRPAQYPLPPSRGRKEFELKGDGTLIDLSLAPNDAHTSTDGKWQLQGDKLILHSPRSRPRECTLEIVTADSDRLVVKK